MGETRREMNCWKRKTTRILDYNPQSNVRGQGSSIESVRLKKSLTIFTRLIINALDHCERLWFGFVSMRMVLLAAYGEITASAIQGSGSVFSATYPIIENTG